MRDFFEGAKILPYASAEQARAALKNGDADLFSATAFRSCFGFRERVRTGAASSRARAIREPRYFGDGVGIAIKKGNGRLREVLDYALARVKASGRYEELMLRYFPLPLY